MLRRMALQSRPQLWPVSRPCHRSARTLVPILKMREKSILFIMNKRIFFSWRALRSPIHGACSLEARRLRRVTGSNGSLPAAPSTGLLALGFSPHSSHQPEAQAKDSPFLAIRAAPRLRFRLVSKTGSRQLLLDSRIKNAFVLLRFTRHQWRASKKAQGP
jgi:hypothetical protein